MTGLLLLPGLLGTVPWEGGAQSTGMVASWETEGPLLLLTVSAPTNGWVAVGFNRTPDLAGARLVMARVRDGEALAEEHRADPPHHPKVADLRVRAAVERPGRTTLTVEVPRAAPQPGGLVLDPSVVGGLVLAFSESDDFGHHSRHRVHLPWPPG